MLRTVMKKKQHFIKHFKFISLICVTITTTLYSNLFYFESLKDLSCSFKHIFSVNSIESNGFFSKVNKLS